MKYIRVFKLFKEDSNISTQPAATKVETSNTDSIDVAADKTNLNATLENVVDFNNRKAGLTNVYLTYKDEKDLVSKLLSQRFISKGTKITDVIFINPLLGMWAQCAQKRRELQDMQNKISAESATMQKQKQSINNNPSSKDTINQNIKDINNQSQIDKKALADLLKATTLMENQVRDRLNQIKIAAQKSKSTVSKSNT